MGGPTEPTPTRNSSRAEMPPAVPVLAPLRTDGAADRDHGPHPDAESASEVSMDEYLRVEVHRGDGLTAVNAAGEIDLATAPEFRAALERSTGRVVVHLDEVTYLDRAASWCWWRSSTDSRPTTGSSCCDDPAPSCARPWSSPVSGTGSTADRSGAVSRRVPRPPRSGARARTRPSSPPRCAGCPSRSPSRRRERPRGRAPTAGARAGPRAAPDCGRRPRCAAPTSRVRRASVMGPPT